MFDFQQKRKIRAFLYHPVTLVILFIFVVFFIHSTWVVYTKKQASENLKNTLLERVENLRARDKELSSRIERLKTNPGVEEEIRSKFTVAKDNENMIIVIEEPDEKLASATPKASFWQKLLNFFFK